MTNHITSLAKAVDQLPSIKGLPSDAWIHVTHPSQLSSTALTSQTVQRPWGGLDMTSCVTLSVHEHKQVHVGTDARTGKFE